MSWAPPAPPADADPEATDEWPPLPPRRRERRIAFAIVAAALIGALLALNVVSQVVRRYTLSAPAVVSPRSGSASSVGAAVDPAIVDINTTLGYRGAKAAGTGIVLTPSGEILTNHHVV